MNDKLLSTIKERFKETGLTQYQLVKLTGLGKKTISRLLNADSIDTFEFFTVECVAEALGLELIFTRKEQKV